MPRAISARSSGAYGRKLAPQMVSRGPNELEGKAAPLKKGPRKRQDTFSSSKGQSLAGFRSPVRGKSLRQTAGLRVRQPEEKNLAGRPWKARRKGFSPKKMKVETPPGDHACQSPPSRGTTPTRSQAFVTTHPYNSYLGNGAESPAPLAGNQKMVSGSGNNLLKTGPFPGFGSDQPKGWERDPFVPRKLNHN